MARIYALVNQKGGVGKTTTAINLGAYLAAFGLRVLVVDLDPQSNATSCLGVDKNGVTGGTYSALFGSAAAGQVLLNDRLKLALLPSSPALAGAEVELVDENGRETRLKEALEPLAEHYDYILIDCPPSLGLLTVNGLVAAKDGALVPVQCEYLALEGLGLLTQTIQRVRQSLFPALKVRGVVLTMFDPRTVRLAEAPSYGLPILAYAPSSSGAQSYEALARELMRGDGVKPVVRQE
jgi:chromosome partitioning protein